MFVIHPPMTIPSSLIYKPVHAYVLEIIVKYYGKRG